MLVGLLALASLTGAVTAPSAPQRYRIEMKAQQEVDLSALGGGKQTTDLGLIGFITVTMSDTTGGQIAHIVVDSVVIPAGIELPPQMGEPATAKGIFFHGYVVDGKVRGGLKPNQPNQLVSMLAGGVENLFPGIRTTAKAGDSWADTVKTDTNAEGMMQQSVTMIDWKATAGANGMLQYDGVANGTSKREGNAGNGKQTVDAKITGTRSLTGPLAGPMQKGTIKAMQDLIVSMEGAPEPFPVTAVTEITFAIIP
jgi:hypothetical protein